VSDHTWTILIPTLGQRADRFQSLVAELLTQVQWYQGQVTITALWNNGERPLSHLRQALVESATSRYISFIDDDDRVPPYHVLRVMEVIGRPWDKVDVVGWRMQCIQDGTELKPTFHSIKYDGWSDDEHGFYRDVSHLNPIRAEIARQVDFRRGDPPEDVSWADQLRSLIRDAGIVEGYVPDVMYYYQANSNDTTWRGVTPTETYVRPEIDSPYFQWLELPSD